MVWASDPLEQDDVKAIQARQTSQVRRKLEIGYNVWKEGIEEALKRHANLYIVQQAFFVVGLTGLMVSRGWEMAKTTWKLL